MKRLDTVSLLAYIVFVSLNMNVFGLCSYCPGVQCLPARCVDAVMDVHGCCLICPNGENCILFGDVVPANQMLIHHTGQCEWTCRCPGSYVYELDRKNTAAVCHMICHGSYVSPDEINESYNLLEPSEAFKKRRTLNDYLRRTWLGRLYERKKT